MREADFLTTDYTDYTDGDVFIRVIRGLGFKRIVHGAIARP
jgi:hypothetical protein